MTMKEFNYFLALEIELEYSFNYIEPDESNFGCYGAKYASLLNAVCVEFEAVAKALIKTVEQGAIVGDIGSIKSQLLTAFPNIEKNEVQVTRIGQTIKPFEGWSSNRLDWWSSYTQLKHNRVQNFHEANLKNLFSAMSALLVLIVYLERFRDKKRDLRTSRVFWMEAMPANFVTEGGDLPDTIIA